MDFFGGGHCGLQDCLAGFLVHHFEPGQIGKQCRRGIARVEREASTIVECPTIPAQMGDMVSAAVVQVDGKQDPVMLGAEFEHKLFLALNPENAVRVSKNVGSEADFQTVFAPFGLVSRKRIRTHRFSKFHDTELTVPKDLLKLVSDPRNSKEVCER